MGTSDSAWDGSSATCTIKDCGRLSTPSQGKMVCTGTTYGSTCSYQCPVGHKLIGPSVRRCRESGKWDGTAPGCKTCTKPATPMNGQQQCQGTKLGDKCT